jgi:hypothetical protein
MKLSVSVVDPIFGEFRGKFYDLIVSATMMGTAALDYYFLLTIHSKGKIKDLCDHHSL